MKEQQPRQANNVNNVIANEVSVKETDERLPTRVKSDKKRGDKPLLLVLVGPTAVGKTALSLTLAKKFSGEIISADSMQVYRGMDIGTAKASPAERAQVPHHLIDCVDPDYPYSVAEYQKCAREAISDVHARGKLPLLVGGTGLYVQAVTSAYAFSEATANEVVRARWHHFREQRGNEALHDKLREVDPDSAARLHPNDVRRIVRALEIFETTGYTMTAYHAAQQKKSPYDLLWIGLTMDRAVLYERINNRVDQMIAAGMVDEVRALKEKGYALDLVSMQGLGYKEIIGFLEGEWSLSETIAAIKQNTRRYAKRQWSWFRRNKDIYWWDLTDESSREKKIAQICQFVAGKLVGHKE